MKATKKKVTVKKTASSKIVSKDKSISKKRAAAKKKIVRRKLATDNSKTVTKVDGKRLKGSRTRARILASAERQFMLNGYEKARFEDIAKELDIVPSAVVYHFPDKRSLYFAVLEDVFSDLFNALKRALAGSGTLQERFESMVVRAVECATDRPATAFFILREAGSIDEDMKTEMQRIAMPFLELLQIMYEEGLQSRSIDTAKINPLHFLSFFTGTICFYIAATPQLAEKVPDNHTSKEQVRLLAQMIINATDAFIGFVNE